MFLGHMYRPMTEEEQAKIKTTIDGQHGNTPHGILKQKIESALDVGSEFAGKQMSMSFNRFLELTNTTAHAKRLFIDGKLRRKDPLRRLTPEEAQILVTLARSGDEAAQELSKAQKDSERSKTAPRLGARDVHRLAALDKSGLYWMYSMLASYGYTPCDNVPHMVNFFLMHAPVIFEAVARIMKQLENQEKYGPRTLALVDNPFGQ